MFITTPKLTRKTLSEAENVATDIFRKAGVESQWIDCPSSSENARADSPDWDPKDSGDLSYFWVNISSRARWPTESSALKGDVMGVAPGTGRSRQSVYVFYSRVETLAARQRMELAEGIVARTANEPQILGHVIAHEIGHELLNLEVHSPTGIMRGNWDLRDLQEANYGELLFTAEQAELVRVSSVARRMKTDVAPESAQSESLISGRTLGQ